MAVLLTSKAKPAEVKVGYFLISPEVMFITSIATPSLAAPIMDNLDLV
jgi:hypothetical protein